MLDKYRTYVSPAFQMQCLLLLGILQCMFMAQFKIVGDFHVEDRVKQGPVPLSLQAEHETPAVEVEELKHQNVFAHQIKEEEPLYNPIILEAANLYNVDLAMVKAIIMAESGYNKKTVSYRGAKGLMQLMPRTARSLGVNDIFDPEQNIHAGVKYFKSLLNRFGGDEKLALAAYNAGARNVRRHKGIPPFKETRRYIEKVLEYQRFYKYGPVKDEKTLS
jgi:soluble lytic murein transglycosylase-like protein